MTDTIRWNSGELALSNCGDIGTPFMKIGSLIAARVKQTTILSIEAVIYGSGNQLTTFNMHLKDLNGNEANYSGRDIEEGLKQVITEMVTHYPADGVKVQTAVEQEG